MIREIKAVIFDMDGTLFQTNTILEPSLVDTFNALRQMNMWEGSTPIEKYQQIMGVPLPVVWETLLPNKTIDSRERANEIFHHSLIENIRGGKGALYPNTIEILAFLKGQGISIFIASNGMEQYLDAIVQYYRLDKWLDGVYSIEQIDSLDKTKLVQKIVEEHHIQSGVVVGDRLSDIKAAKGNGLKAIGCHFDFAQEEELKEADVVIQNLSQLKELVGMEASSKS